MTKRTNGIRLMLGAASLLFPVTTYAQETVADREGSTDAQDIIIVTGTKIDRTSFSTPASVGLLDEEQLKTFSAGSGSQADILQQLPGINAEGGGGEVATNLRVRGLPSGGQFEFTPLLVDGVPIFSSFGLNSSAFDFFQRNDLGIERLEFNKGGVANLFGVGGTAGQINYITRSGADEATGAIQVEYRDRDGYRGDFAFAGPVSDQVSYAVSGFYRFDEGPIETGLDTEGFALRGDVSYAFEDGSGSFRLSGNYINDRVQFFLPTILDGQSMERISGNDGSTVYSLNSSDIAGLSVPSPEGLTEFNPENGFRTVGGHIYAIFDKELGDGWGVEAKAKFSSLDSGSNFFNAGLGGQPGGGLPETQAEYLANRGIDPALEAVFTFAEPGAGPLAADALIIENQFNDRERDATDGTFEFNVTKEVEAGGMTHNLTAGTFFARAEADNIQRSVLFLGDFNNNPSLVSVTVGGQDLVPNGIVQAPSGFANQTRTSFRRAVYIADQIDAGRWQFDIGARLEANTVNNRFEGSEMVASEISDNIFTGTDIETGEPITAQVATATFGNGVFSEGDASATGWAIAGAVGYEWSDEINLYANASRGFFFPQAQGTGGQISNTGDIQVFDEEPVIQASIGAKYRNSWINGYAEVFYTGLRDRSTVVFADNSTDPVVFNTETDTFGIELDANLALGNYLTLSGNLIWQDAEFVGESVIGASATNPGTSISGNEITRLPSLTTNLGLLGEFGGFDGSIFWQYNDDTFQDFGNGVELDAFNVVRLNAGYTFPVGDADSLRFSLNVWNLFDDEGLQEGNPRAGLLQAADETADFFVGRPILPRRVSVQLGYSF